MNNSGKISLMLFIFLFMTTCAINQLRNIASDPTFNPKWNLNADIPVFDKTFSLNDKGEFNNIKINSLSSPAISLFSNNWPILAPATNLLAIQIPPIASIPITVQNTVDLDNDSGNDLTAIGFYSKDSTLTLTVWLMEDTTITILPIDPGQISINSFTMEGVDYNFTYSYTDPTNRLVYKSTNFLDPNHGYYLHLTGNTINITSINVGLNSTPASPFYPSIAYPTTHNLSLYFQLDFTLGSTYGIVGQIVPLPANNLNPPPINVTNPLIPTAAILIPDITVNLGSTIQSVGITNINNLKFTYIFDSTVANDFIADFTFTADQNPTPNIFQPTISASNLSFDTLNNYSYVSSLKQTNVPLNITSLPTLNNLKMTINILLPNSAGNIRISPTDTIRVRLNVSGQATVGSN